MRVLIIVHLEPDFNPSEDLVNNVIKYSRQFDHTINVTSASGLTGTQPFERMVNFHEEEWIWGYDADYYKEEEGCNHVEGVDWIPSGGHDYSFIEQWMRDLNKHNRYTLVGGARNECLRDVADIFSHLGLKYRIKEELTY